MSKEDDGGPAFPQGTAFMEKEQCIDHGDHGGMTLKMWLAGQALGAMRIENSDNPLYWSGIAKSCFAAADAMLEALK